EPSFVAYRLLQGRPLVDEDGAGVRAFLDAVHALVHGDLGPEHLLVRDGKLAAVIDWGDARIGDPALDYAWLLHGPFPDWDVDAGLSRQARFYHRLGPWFEAHYGLFVKSSEHVEGGLAGIRERLDL